MLYMGICMLFLQAIIWSFVFLIFIGGEEEDVVSKRKTKINRRWGKKPSADKLRKRQQAALRRATKLAQLRDRLAPHLAYLDNLCVDAAGIGDLEKKLGYPYAKLLIKVYVIHFCLRAMCEGACLRWAIQQARKFFPKNTLSESTGYEWVKEFLNDAEVVEDENGERSIKNEPFIWHANGGGSPSIFRSNLDLRDDAIAWVRENRVRSGQKNMTAEDFMNYVNETLFPKYRIGEAWIRELRKVTKGQVQLDVWHPKKIFRTIGLTCATETLHTLGFTYCAAQGGIFSDEHDKEENVKYRNEKCEVR